MYLLFVIAATPNRYPRNERGARATCSHAVCLCDMEMFRCFNQYGRDLDRYSGWAQSNACAFLGMGSFYLLNHTLPPPHKN